MSYDQVLTVKAAEQNANSIKQYDGKDFRSVGKRRRHAVAL